MHVRVRLVRTTAVLGSGRFSVPASRYSGSAFRDLLVGLFCFFFNFAWTLLSPRESLGQEGSCVQYFSSTGLEDAVSTGHRSWVSGHRPVEWDASGFEVRSASHTAGPGPDGQLWSQFPRPQAGADDENRGADMEIGEEGHCVGGTAAATDPRHQQQTGGQRSGPCSVRQRDLRRDGSRTTVGCQHPHLIDADRETGAQRLARFLWQSRVGGQVCLFIQLKRKSLQAAIRME